MSQDAQKRPKEVQELHTCPPLPSSHNPRSFAQGLQVCFQNAIYLGNVILNVQIFVGTFTDEDALRRPHRPSWLSCAKARTHRRRSAPCRRPGCEGEEAHPFTGYPVHCSDRQGVCTLSASLPSALARKLTRRLETPTGHHYTPSLFHWHQARSRTLPPNLFLLF